MLASTFVSNGWLWESVYGCKKFYGRAVLCTHCTTACSMTKCCKRYHVLWYLVHLNSTRNIDLGYILAHSTSIIFKWLKFWCLIKTSTEGSLVDYIETLVFEWSYSKSNVSFPTILSPCGTICNIIKTGLFMLAEHWSSFEVDFVTRHRVISCFRRLNVPLKHTTLKKNIPLYLMKSTWNNKHYLQSKAFCTWKVMNVSSSRFCMHLMDNSNCFSTGVWWPQVI